MLILMLCKDDHEEFECLPKHAFTFSSHVGQHLQHNIMNFEEATEGA